MVLQRVKEIIADQLHIDTTAITPEQSITSEIGADSLDAIDILMNLEDEFNVDIPERKIGTKVCDIVQFIESNQAQKLKKSA